MAEQIKCCFYLHTSCPIRQPLFLTDSLDYCNFYHQLPHVSADWSFILMLLNPLPSPRRAMARFYTPISLISL
ncbi:hypothetical protein [Coleofasciculus sp. E1-EBD-02]|uniref:hypothetical protein n=1 Tax=Coleofasciculus sp. E1-EBD-02 TaxID=3068481 RepID=UPI0032FEEEB3